MTDPFRERRRDELTAALRPLLGPLQEPVKVPSGENIVVRTDTARWGEVAVRLSPASRRSRDQLEAELSFIRCLIRGGASVVPPLEPVFPKPVHWAGAVWWAVAFPWIAGSAPDISDPDALRTWGVLLGQIHMIAAPIGPLPGRPRWSSSGHFAIDWYLADWSEKERSAMRRILGTLQGPSAVTTCHGDLGWANVVWPGGRATAIDFDDCCTAPSAYDIAATTVDLLVDHSGELRLAPDSALEALALGYGDVVEGGAHAMCSPAVDCFLWVLLIERCVTARRTGPANPEADHRLREALRSGVLPSLLGPGRRRYGQLFV
ncbi:MAG: phosphotransferase enzyme family protein [Streptosporangiaceae bacterium]